ncbi:MAG: hypothetical protein ACTJHU_04845 [Mycetocola sp.]
MTGTESPVVTSGFVSVDTDRLHALAGVLSAREDSFHACAADTAQWGEPTAEGGVVAEAGEITARLRVLAQRCGDLSATLRSIAWRSDSADVEIAGELSSAAVQSGPRGPAGAALHVAVIAHQIFGPRGASASRQAWTRAASALAQDGSGGPVSVRGSEARGVSPAHTLEDHLARSPSGGVGGAQLRVERYHGSDGAADTVVAYIAGTQEDPDGSEPFDWASNIAGIGGEAAASLRGVERALADSGVTSSDRLHLVGYSQGGLVAARIASGDRYSVESTTVFGSPGDGVPVDGSVEQLTMRHRDDVVPVLSGGEPLGYDPSRVVVTGVSGATGASLFAAHGREHYRTTAAATDRAHDPRVRAHLAGIRPEAERGQVRDYRITEPPRSSETRPETAERPPPSPPAQQPPQPYPVPAQPTVTPPPG